MITTHLQPPNTAKAAPAQTPTRSELVALITDFCLDLVHHCDGHVFTKGSPALDVLAMYAYGAVHVLADRNRLNLRDRHMLGAKLYLEFFGQNASLALANACALAGAAHCADSPRHAAIEGSAEVFRQWQRDPASLDATDFRAYLPWPDTACALLPALPSQG
jgi:hypothetical protein